MSNLLYHMGLFSIWFGIGIYINKNSLNSKYGLILKNYIHNLSIIKLILVIFTFSFFISFLFTIIFDYYFNFELLNYSELRLNVTGDNTINTIESEGSNLNNNTNENTSNNSSTSTKEPGKSENITNNNNSTNNPTTGTSSNLNIGNLVSKGGSLTVMAAGLVGGMKYANTPSAKIIGAGIGVGAGALAIAAANITSNLTSDLGKKKFINLNIEEILAELLNFTNNNAIDLLIIVQTYQKFQLILLGLISYNFIFTYINENKVENLLSKVFPDRVVKILILIILNIKKSSKLLLICLFILLIICNLYSYYYLNFFIINIEGIIEYYFKK